MKEMRQFFLVVLALALFSCSGNRQQTETAVATFELDNLLAVADQEVDKTVTVTGIVTHTCKHSGKKCFIVGESQAVSLQVFVDAEGEIEMFTPDLIGSKLAITGVFKEEHTSQEEIDEYEKSIKIMEEEGTSPEACATELASIKDMRQWMADHGKDYFVSYYMEGLKYEVLDN